MACRTVPIPLSDPCLSPADQSVKQVIVELLVINSLSALNQIFPKCLEWEDVNHEIVRGRNLLFYRLHVWFESVENVLNRLGYTIRTKVIGDLRR